jgi:recombination protein RecT
MTGTKLVQLREFVEGKQQSISKTLPTTIDADRFVQVALLTATKRPDLWECSKESMMLAILESARAGLFIDNKEATIIPYNGQAQFMPMVQGIIRLMLRSPKVLKIEARAVYEGDDLKFQYGLNPRLDHVPRVIPSDDALTHAYAIVWKQDAEPQFEIMTREEIEIVRLSSRAKEGPWDNYYGEMSRKSVSKRVSKYIDLSREAQRVIAMDHELFGDPSMNDYVDGLSPEYKNQLVKTETQAGLDRLKEDMKDDPDPEPPEPEDDVEISHNATAVQAVVNDGSAQDPRHADEILNRLGLRKNVKPETAVAASKIYRAYRDAGDTSEAAAVKTNQDMSDG